jgi:tripartite-type tricarboxylate transporter receptor subunit TctC
MKIVKSLAALAAGLLLSLSAAAQTWPHKPVRFIVPFPPGGATDISARLLSEKLTELWGQSVVIENRGGAGGGVGAAEAAKMTPDGHNFFFPSGSVVTANQHIYAKLNYDPEKDFVPVTNVVTGPQVLVVPASSPFKSVQELIAAVKKEPGKYTFGHAGIGSQIHLAAENFVYPAKLDAISVPYKGEGPALAGLIGGETTFMLPNMAAAIGHVAGGRLRALGVTSAEEAPQMPGVPPIGRTVTGFVNSGWFGIVAPAGTSPEIIDRMYKDVKKALDDTRMKARFYAMGLAPVGNSPADLAKALKEETKLWAVVVRERKISVK